MIETCASNYSEMKEYEELGHDEYEEIIKPLWEEELPEDLLLIGGIDNLSWAKICRDDRDPHGIFRGEYRDKFRRYVGTFRYVHPEGKAIPEEVFKDYYMVLIEDNGILFQQTSEKQPIDYFHMVPTHPKDIQRAIY